jgi:hypothetical protein
LLELARSSVGANFLVAEPSPEPFADAKEREPEIELYERRIQKLAQALSETEDELRRIADLR